MDVLLTGATAVTLVLVAPFIGHPMHLHMEEHRVVARNGRPTLIPVLMVLIGLRYGREDMFVDMALALFLLNLFMTLLIARYVRDKVVDG